MLLRGTLKSCRFPTRCSMFVSSNGVLHHTPDMPAALREIARVLRPGGRLVMIVYNRASLHYWCQQVVIQGIVRGQLF